MATLTIEVPDAVIAESGLSLEAFAQDARFLLAAKLFELGRLTTGRAAALCGLERGDFLLALRDVGVSMIRMDLDDLRAELGRV